MQIVFMCLSKHAHRYDEELCHLGDLFFQEDKVENKNEITAVLPKEIASISFVYVNIDLPRSLQD